MNKFWFPKIILAIAFLNLAIDLYVYIRWYLEPIDGFEEFRSEVFSFSNLIHVVIYNALLLGGAILLYARNVYSIHIFLLLGLSQIVMKVYGAYIFITNPDITIESNDLYISLIIILITVVLYLIPVVYSVKLKAKGYYKHA